MNSKMLMGGVLGGVAFFLLGWLLYGTLMADAMAGCSSCQRGMEDMSMGYMIAGNLFMGLAASFMLSNWTNINTFMGGLRGGAVFALLLAIGYNSIMWATTTVYTDRICILYDLVITTIMWGIVAGVIGWWNGRK